MSNRVTVDLVGNDKFSGVVKSAMGNISNSVKGVMGTVGALGSKGASVFTKQLKSGQDSYKDLLLTAGSMQQVMGGSFDAALSEAKGLNNEFVKLGAALPGVADDYATIGRGVADDLYSAALGQDGILDKDWAVDTVRDLSRGFGIIANATNTSSQEAAIALQRALGGDKGAFRLLMFDKTPAFKKAISQMLEADGKTLADWDKVSTKQRADWLNKAANLTVPPEAINALENTLDGVMSSWKNALLDPTTGLLGFNRDVGGKTALSSITELFQALDSQFKALGDFNLPDPMAALIGFTDNLTNWVDSGFSLEGIDLNSALSGVADSISSLFEGLSGTVASLDVGGLYAKVSDGIASNMAGVASSLGQVVGSMISGATEAIATINNSIDFAGLVAPIAANMRGSLDGFFSPIVSGLDSAFVSITSMMVSQDWTALGANLANGLYGGIQSALGAVMGILANPNLYAALLSIGVAVFQFSRSFTNTLKSNILNSVGQGLTMAGSAIVSGLSGLWSSLTTSVSGIISNIAASIGASMATVSSSLTMIGSNLTTVFSSITLRVQSALSGLGAMITGTLSNMVATFTAMGATLQASFSGIAASLMATISGIGTNILATITGMGASISAALAGAASMAVSAAMGLGSMISSGISNLMSSIASAINGALSNAASAVKGALSSAVSGAVSGARAKVASILPKYSGNISAAVKGHIPTAARGLNNDLLGALVKERKHKPSGSNLVVANDSEMILNRRQQKRLSSNLQPNFNVSKVASAKGSSTPSTHNHNVNITMTGTAITLDDLVDRLNEYYRTFNLAPSI